LCVKSSGSSRRIFVNLKQQTKTPNPEPEPDPERKPELNWEKLSLEIIIFDRTAK